MAQIQLDDVSVSYFMRRTLSTDAKFERGAVGAQVIVGNRYIEIAALRNVSLSLADGDRVGLVGSNGSGKTTLLKLCAGALAVQAGTFNIEGVVSPQFALGAGLRADLTGRQNAELKCLYLGVPQRSIARCLEELKSISGLGGYFELPLRSYSAGMHSRLVMSLLRLVRGEILIMDEWINTVDPSLSETINGLQTQLISRSKILLLASHSERILKEWVNKILWLDQGTVMGFGPIDEIYKEYNNWRRR
ncbi:ABC transporter ATP-binding protein [Aquamicrobium terrae]